MFAERSKDMKVPYNKFTGIHFLSLAISSLLINDRHSGTEEVSESTKRRMDGEKTEFLPPSDPKGVPFEEIEEWENRHPGFKLKILYPRDSEKDSFNVLTQLKENNNQRFNSFKMRRPARLWQPNGQVPRREKQEGLEAGLKKLKSPYR